MGELPLISVCVIAYNHERFILDCLEGIAAQDYPKIELVISNDASSDHTHAKIKSFIEKFEQSKTIKVKYYNQTKNLGICPNLKFALDECTGEFIALCEGDDYWVSRDKLKRQLHAIDNTFFSACFHDVQYKRSGKIFKSFIDDFSGFNSTTLEVVTIKEMMDSKWIVPTCSFFMKREHLVLPEFFDELKFGDFPLFCSVAAKGDFCFLQGIEAVYRMDNPGSQINKVDPLGAIMKHLDYIRLLEWLRRQKNVKEIDTRIEFHIRKSRSAISSFTSSRIYSIVSSIQRMVRFFFGKRNLLF